MSVHHLPANYVVCRYEQAKITSFVAEAGVHFHLGMKYNKDSQSFEWVNGDDFTYSHWAEFEPGWFLDHIFRLKLFKILSIMIPIVLGGVHICTGMRILVTGK